MAMMWRILIAALVLGSLGCDTEAEKIMQTEKERKDFFTQSGRWPSPDSFNDRRLAVELNLPLLTTELISQNLGTLLSYAAQQNAVETAKVLLKHGADANANAKGADDQTPLHYAAQQNAVETAEVLLKHGADANAKGADDQTPLHYAAQQNAVETAKVLLKHGADANAKGADDQTPLHYAAQQNAVETAKVLFKHGADANIAENRHLATPLHYAAQQNAVETAKVLLKHGADANAKNRYNQTPLDVAEQDMEGFLRRYMRIHPSHQLN